MVALVFDDSPRAVAYWVTRFKEDGVGGLEEGPRSGRPSKLKPAQLEKLKTFVVRSLANRKPMNAEILSEYIAATFEVTLTERQCWRILQRFKRESLPERLQGSM